MDGYIDDEEARIGFTDLPTSRPKFAKNITTLSLQENCIRIVPGWLAGLTSLSELILADNGIEYLPDGVFAPLKNMTILNLRGNRLKQFPTSISDLNQLKALHLRGTRINFLNVRLPIGLEHLDAGNNRFDASSTALEPLKSLKSLSLGGCFLERLPPLPENLEKLFLDDNWLTEVPKSIFGLRKLKVLDLRRNKFSVPLDHLRPFLPALEVLDLEGNPCENR